MRSGVALLVAGFDQPVLGQLVESDQNLVPVGLLAELLGQHADEVPDRALAVAASPHHRCRSIQAEDELALLVVDQQPTVGLFGSQAVCPRQGAEVSHEPEHSSAC